MLLKLIHAYNIITYIGFNEKSGAIAISKKEIIEDTKNYNGKFMWKNIYGPPNEATSTENKKLMIENPDLGTSWRGRILI